MIASQRFGRSMIPVRSVEQLSCLTRQVTEADRSPNVENADFQFWEQVEVRGTHVGAVGWMG